MQERPAERTRRAHAPYRLIKRLAIGLAAKWSSLRGSYRLTRIRNPEVLRALPPAAILRALQQEAERGCPTRHDHHSAEDERLCETIRHETDVYNRNNVTRTMAYWRMYEQHPELHWALLAHLVSRNGGWSMTDLQGQWLPRLLEPTLTQDIFRMLEACNSLIFADAFPQLLLYAESKRRGVSLARLLPSLGISAFMRPFWKRFAEDQAPAPLTSALIINEQHVIQRPIVEDHYYIERVLSAPAFRSQPWLQTNQIVFPLANSPLSPNTPLLLAGRVLESFADLSERIRFGQTLYAMLFGYPAIHARAIAFAASTPHTGSRADYWPHRFRAEQQEDGTPQGHAVSTWYSPTLANAWPDQPVNKPVLDDWLNTSAPAAYLRNLKLPRVVDMTHEHLFGQSKLEAAALVLRSFKNGDSSLRTGRG